MSDLTDQQLAILRSERGNLGAKELAKQLGLPRAKVEEALAELDGMLPVWRGREHEAWAVVGALLIVVGAWAAYGGNLQAGYHFDDKNRHNPLAAQVGSTADELYVFKHGPLRSVDLPKYAARERITNPSIQLPLAICDSGYCWT